MKKLLKVMISLMMFVFTGCGKSNDMSAKILCPTGAPALSLVGTYEKVVKEGKVDFVEGADALMAELAKKDSEYDIIVAPVNVGCKLMEKGATDFRLKGVVTWGNLYIVAADESVLKESGDIALFGKESVPEKIYAQVSSDITLTGKFFAAPTDVTMQLVGGKVKAGMLAEPAATATIAKAKQAGKELKIIKNLQADFNGGKGYPQAAVFVKDGSAYASVFEDMDQFTNNGYTGLSEALDTVGVENLGLPNKQIVEKTIDRMNVHYKDASECKDELTGFLKLFGIEYNEDMLAK